jgi:uncharacterized membrane protein YhiD involved in acid resistance
MKKLTLWTTAGMGLAIGCGVAGLPHLSASIAALIVFCAAPALLVLALDSPPKLGKTRT